MRTEQTGWSAAVAALTLVAGGCGGGAAPAPSGSEPPAGPPAAVAAPIEEPANVVVISVDTLRADHLGCYGYSKPTTPNLDRLASRATLYESCITTAPWTLPAHASLFTGRFASEHGAHFVRLATPSAESGSLVAPRPLPDEATTLAEVLTEAGYATAAFAANDSYLAPRVNLDQGFATYHVKRTNAEPVTTQALEWIARQRGRPFFLFVNYMDCHRPYTREDRRVDPLPAPVAVEGGQIVVQLDTLLTKTGEDGGELIEAMTSVYDRALGFVDEQIGRLIAWLEARGLYDSTLIVVTSDHGEFLGEHRLTEHPRDVYQEVLWVPLIVKEPRQTAARVEARRMSLVCVPRLVLELADGGLEARAQPTFPYALGEIPVVSELHYSRLGDLRDPELIPRFDRVRRAVFDGRFKYIESSDGKHELYDLESDPRELVNLIEQRPEVAERLARGLQSFQSQLAPLEPATETLEHLDPTEKRRLRELGYF
jgi:arylsulfatase A-like enzyme